MKNKNIKKIVLIAMFSSISAVLMLFNFPIPIAPSFMKMDLSEIPLVIGTFLLDFNASICMVFLKQIIKIIIKPSSTFYVGELSNLIGNLFYVVPCSIIYSKYKNKTSAIYSLILACILTSIVSTIVNSLFVFPMYIKIFGMSELQIIEMCKKINPYIDSINKVYIMSVFPFNLVKYGISSIVSFFVYKRISNLIKKI